MGNLFGMFDPSKEGPGVSKGGKQKRRFFLFFDIYFRKFTKIVLLNLIYVLVCIPIVTIGPATAGLTYCMRNFAREDHADISDFFDQFKKNFWQSLFVWLLFTIGFAVIIFGIIFYDGLAKQNNILGFVGLVFAIVAAVLFLFMSYYVYMIIVTFRVNFRQLIKNAFIFAFVGLGRNIITTLIVGIIYGWLAINIVVPIVFPLFDPNAPASLDAVAFASVLYLFFIPSLASFIVNFNIYPCVKKFMIDPTLAKQVNSHENDETIFEDAE